MVRLRTNYRKDEEVYLYRTNVPPSTARAMFLARTSAHPELAGDELEPV